MYVYKIRILALPPLDGNRSDGAEANQSQQSQVGKVVDNIIVQDDYNFLVCMYLALGSFPERDARETLLCFCVVVLHLRLLPGMDCLSLEACPLVHHCILRRVSEEAWSVVCFFFLQSLSLGHQKKLRGKASLVFCGLSPGA